MWLTLAFISATLLGFYDVAKKQAVTANAVLPVLLLTTLGSTLLFLPALLSEEFGFGWFDGGPLDSASYGLAEHLMVMLKACIVLSSWVLGYFAIKHLPITIVGPVNATRPVMVLVGAVLIFGERLNLWQWSGVLLSITSIFLLSLSSRKEGISFVGNVWILALAGAAVMGAASGLYDKHIMRTLNPVFVQSWHNLYQTILMTLIVGVLWYPRRHSTTPFRWSWAIPVVSVVLSLADMAYFAALSDEGAMISVVSMVRRSSVVVSFSCGALLFGERNLRAKAVDLMLILIGMALLYIGSRY